MGCEFWALEGQFATINARKININRSNCFS